MTNKKEKASQYRLLVKHEVIEKYGGKCKCCGEAQILFLTIDHKKNDGNKDRLNLFNTKAPASGAWYLKLRREPKRKDLQVLCYNCNLGKALNFGVCPHKKVIKKLSKSYDNRHNPQFDKRTKIIWPTDKELIRTCNGAKSIASVAESLGVSLHAVINRLKRRNKYHLVKKRTGAILIGEENKAAKLNEKQVLKIRKLAKENVPRRILALKFNVSKSTIDKIITYKLWANLL